MPLPKPKVKGSKDKASKPLDIAIAETEEQDEESGILDIDGDSIEAATEKVLKMSVFEPAHRYWLDLKNKYLNAVLGSAEKGVPYGKVIEIGGPEHTGKTMLATILMGLAQHDGAAAGYMDLEDSRDEQWATKLGVRWSAVTKFYPKLVRPTSKKNASDEEKTLVLKSPPRLLTAEEIFEQAETAMFKLSRLGAERQFWFLDSIAMIVTAKQYEVGISGATMNSKLDRAALLAQVLPRWAGLAANYNALILVSNQMRSKIGGFVMSNDPDDTTGGKALRHACAIRCRTRRVKGGRLKNGKNIIGLAGCIRNIKNKAGEGSQEGAECGFKVLWSKPKASIEFMSMAELKEDIGEE